MAAPIRAVTLMLSVAVSVVSCEPAEAILHGGWFLKLQLQESDILISRGNSPLFALCETDVPANFTIHWAGGLGTCANSSSSDDAAFTNTSVYSEYGSVLRIELNDLPLALYHHVKCVARTATTSTTLCRQFRVYEYRIGESLAYDDKKIRMSCGSGMIPTDVAVNVVWSLDSRTEPLLNETLTPPNDGSQLLTYNVTPSEIVLNRQNPLGGIYQCSVTNPQFGELFWNEVKFGATPVAVITGQVERNYSGSGKTRITMRCEGYGFNTPTLDLVSFRRPSRYQEFEISGGRVFTADFYSADGEPLYLRFFRCVAKNAWGTSAVSYNSNETDWALNLAPLPSGNAPIFRALATLTLLSRLY